MYRPFGRRSLAAASAAQPAGYGAPQPAAPAYPDGADTGGLLAREPLPAAPPTDSAPTEAFTLVGPPASYVQGNNVAGTGAYREGATAPAGQPPPSSGGRPRTVARRGRLAVAALLLVLIVVGVIIALRLR